MISDVIVPDLGATGRDVTLVEWLVKPGDTVEAGQPLFVVATDKATVEVEAFRDGVVRELRAEAGASVQIGATVAVLADTVDEPLPEQVAPLASAAGAPPTPSTSPAAVPNWILASPLARRIAREEGIDLAAVTGSGRQGQILKRDVLQAVERNGTAVTAAGAGVRREPVSPMRRAIAGRTRRSKAEAPHFTAAITVDMQGALALHRQAAAWAEQKGWAPPTLTDICIRAAALALREVPTLNASFQDDAILTYEAINIGLVVGLPEGMLIPVVRHADRHNLFTLAGITKQLKARAASGELSQPDLSGGTFTLSNLGMFGLDSFTAVINPPEAGILALGAVREQPAVWKGRIVPRPLMVATLSVDHRLVDGVVAARFVATFKELLENPLRLALDAPQEPPA